jgi:hypothetical protein
MTIYALMEYESGELPFVVHIGTDVPVLKDIALGRLRQFHRVTNDIEWADYDKGEIGWVDTKYAVIRFIIQAFALAATSAPAPESVAAEPEAKPNRNDLEDVETGEAKEE